MRRGYCAGAVTSFVGRDRFILLLIFALSAMARPCAAAISFRPPVTYTVGGGADDVVAADLDGDGYLDLAAANLNNVTVLYGKGDGTFEAPVDYSVGSGMAEILPADVNGDGKPDLVIAVASANTVAGLINLGNRKFAPAVSYPVGTQPYGVTAADFNGDGKLDLAVSNNLSHNMSVLLNNGDGTFASAVFYGGSSYPARVKSADFNGDGKIDLAMSNYVSADVLIYFGDGAGGFTAVGDYGVGDYPAQIIIDDFNGDGILDLATANTFSHNVSILFGHGDGTFTVSPLYPANTYPHIMGSADLDGDGDRDLAIPNNGTDYFTVLENTGGGVFAAPVTVTSGGTNIRSLTIGDFDRDGRPDVAVSNSDQGTISVFINNTARPGPVVSSLTITPDTVKGGETAIGEVTLDRPAGSGGVVVALSSDDPAVTVPDSVTVDEGATTATFNVTTSHVDDITDAIISASANGVTVTATLTILPPVALIVDPDAVIGGEQAVGTVILDEAAATDTVFALASDSTVALLPASITVPAGETGADFTIKTKKVSSDTSVTLQATANGFTATATLAVQTIGVKRVAITPKTVRGGNTALGKVTLNKAAPPGGLVVTLSSSDTSVVTVPATVTVLAGRKTATFAVSTSVVSSRKTILVVATGNGVSKGTTLTVRP